MLQSYGAVAHQGPPCPQQEAWQQHWDMVMDIAPKFQASVPASKSCLRNPGAREIRKKLGQGGAGEGRTGQKQSWEPKRAWTPNPTGHDGRGRCLGSGRRGAMEGVGNQRRMTWDRRRRSMALCRPGSSLLGGEGM